MRPNLVPRESLRHKLAGGLARRLVLGPAAPGFGKTTKKEKQDAI
jgi:ATP/maltotriose-dependent transcriptional regulator MalT